MSYEFPQGHPLGLHRVLDVPVVLPQNANRLDADSPLYHNELLIDVSALQIDAASFNQLLQTHKESSLLAKAITDIVNERGKMQNPVTGSGGMLLGKVSAWGPAFPDQSLQPGQDLATLVSLTATPLKISKIKEIDVKKERVFVSGQAILFAQSLYALLPNDLSQGAALAAYDICGAPLLVCRHTKAKNTIFVLGLGKAGRSVLAGLHHQFGTEVKILGCDASTEAVEYAKSWSLFHQRDDVFDTINAQDPIAVMKWVQDQTHGAMADLSVNLVNVSNTEMPTVLATKDQGKAIFFSMATDFQKAALGTEAVGLDVQLLMGVGYVNGHAQYMLEVLRGDSVLKSYFESNFGD